MRLIGTLPTEAESRRFCDYLLTQRAPAHFEQGAGGAWQIWIENDDQIDLGRDELQRFAAAPADARYDAAGEAKQIRAQAEKAAARRRKNFRDVRTSGMFNTRTPAVTTAIIATTVVLTLAIQFGNASDPDGISARLWRAMLFDNPIHNMTSTLPPSLGMFASIARGQVWRLVTPIFIHYGVLHLLFNMMWMLDLGRRIETVRGGGRFLTYVLVIAVISCALQALWEFSAFGGMSGVVAGLFGYAWMCGYFRPYEQIGLIQYEIIMMLGWLVICSFGFVGPIANAAHWGGLLTGMAMGAAPSLWRRARRL